MIVERDIGRLAKYTFDMGGAGDLLSLSLNVAPWEDLHELSREELRLTNLVTTEMVAQLGSPNAAAVELTPEPVQDRFVSRAVETRTNPEPARSIKAAEAMGPTGGVRAAASPGAYGAWMY
jgi:bifunctional ADP-heptose synthase (sugar kinase/adenylyltransferase)